MTVSLMKFARGAGWAGLTLVFCTGWGFALTSGRLAAGWALATRFTADLAGPRRVLGLAGARRAVGRAAGVAGVAGVAGIAAGSPAAGAGADAGLAAGVWLGDPVLGVW